MQEWIEGNIREFAARPDNTLLIVGTIWHGERTIYSFGSSPSMHETHSQPDPIFEIGSLSKLFTVTLLSLLVSTGVLCLDDPVREFSPQLANLPQEITLLHLATHTSGLPKMPSDITKSMFKNRRNPYAAYSIQDLLDYLSGTHIKWRPQKQIRYSNLGMGLLGHILEIKSSMPYEQTVISRICDLLDMRDTRISLSAEQAARLAPPHTSRGKPVQNWDMPAFAGAGGLRSSPQDLLKFLEANMVEEDTTLSEAMQNCHTIRSHNFTPMGRLNGLAASLLDVRTVPEHYRQGIALGWVVGQLQSGGHELHWHHGATGGYRSFVGFAKATGTGVVVLANSGPSMLDGFFSTTATDHLGLRIMERLHAPG